MCPICSAKNVAYWGIRDKKIIYICNECDVTFFERPVIFPTNYDDYYPYLKHFDERRVNWELSLRKEKYRKQLAKIRSYDSSLKYLVDIGAGPGYFCHVANLEGWKAIAVETAAPAVSAGRKWFDVQYTNLDDIEASSQDVITCHHVIEHIENPISFLNTVISKIKSGGILVVHVPHREPLSFLLRNYLAIDLQRNKVKEKYCSMYYPIHITGFNESSLKETMHQIGMEVIEIVSASMWSYHYDPFFLRNYFVDVDGTRHPQMVAAVRVAKHAARCIVDRAGDLVGRGDWVIGHFRKPTEDYVLR